MKTRFLLVLLFPPLLSFAGDTASIPRNKYAGIFNTIFLAQKELFGIFDSTDSYFVVHQDTAFQSPFDSNCLRVSGKTWHRDQIMSCQHYLTINDITQIPFEMDKDSADQDTAVLRWQKYLVKKKLQLWKCEGEFFMNENPDAEYSGSYSGGFHVYFLFDPVKKQVLLCDAKYLTNDEPVALWSGFWHAFKHKELPPIAFFWASTKPHTIEGGAVLPDLRMQSNGSQSNTNMAELDSTCRHPEFGKWFK